MLQYSVLEIFSENSDTCYCFKDEYLIKMFTCSISWQNKAAPWTLIIYACWVTKTIKRVVKEKAV